MTNITAKNKHTENHIKKEHDRWIRKIGPQEPYQGQYVLGIHDVLRAHFSLLEYFSNSPPVEGVDGVGGVGPRDENLLHSAVGRQTASYGGQQKYTDKFDICATLFYGLIKNHPFHDCNKRTALLSALYQLQQAGRCPNEKTKEKELDQLTIQTAKNRLSDYPDYKKFEKLENPDIKFISSFFRRATREIDKRHYIITFSQLDRILRRFNCRLDNPQGNYIDIVKTETETRSFLGLTIRTQLIERKVAQVGFPGWKERVSKNALHTIRKATNLTVENGIDSKVFFYDLEPIESLIARYSAPLRRLANK